MNTKTTLILSVILLLMSGYYYFFEIKGTQEKVVKEEQEKKLLNVTTEQINNFSYRNTIKSAEGSFVKKGSDWYLEKPVSYKGDNTNISSLLDSLVNAKYEEKIEGVKNPEDFGLSSPRIQIGVKSTSGEDEIKVGSESPTNTGFYLMKKNDPNVYLVPMVSFYALDKPLTELRDRTLLDIEREKIKHIRIKNQNASFVLEKSGNDWMIKEPKLFKADTSKIEEWFDKLKNEKLSDFVSDNPQDIKLYGLGNPHILITVGEKPEQMDKTFMIGEQTGDYNYARNNHSPSVFKISRSISEKFKFNLNDIRNKSLLSFDGSKATRIEIESLALNTILERDKDKNWKFVKKDEKSKATESDIGAMVDQLSSLNTEKFISKEKFSLGDRIINITINVEGQNNPLKITFGGKTPENKEQIFCMKPDITTEGYAINASILSKVFPN